MRKTLAVVICLVILTSLAIPVSAATGISSGNIDAIVSPNGSCQVTLDLTVHLEGSGSDLLFPIPADARNITVNGNSASTSRGDGVRNIRLSSVLGNVTGDFTIRIQYTLPSVVAYDDSGKLMLKLPMLSGFNHPIENLTFSISLPGEIPMQPDFFSGYHQQAIESSMTFTTAGSLVRGTVVDRLKDRETLYMHMAVTEELFPQAATKQWGVGVVEILMAVAAGLAVVYWAVFLRCAPFLGRRSASAPAGYTGGELAGMLCGSGNDLTMMVFSWAQLGYVRIRVDRSGRIFLEKRMEMGNERTDFELKTFRALFSRGDTLEATGMRYAKLFRQVNDHIPGIQEMYTKRAGNVKIFRILCCGVSVFCGICFAMNLIPHGWLQLPVKILLIVVGAITGWAIQDGMYKFHIRGKIPVYVGSVCGILWIVLGIISGVWLIGLVTVAVQNLAGLAAAYGGRRSDLGRYNASEILGVRHYLKHVGQEELDRLVSQNPDYFFDMLPYAIALGVDTPFAKAFGNRKIPDCTYLAVRKNEKRSAVEWAYMVRKLADRMDSLQRKMELETWIPVSLNGPADTGRPAPARNSRNAGRRDSRDRSGRPASDRSSRNGSGSSASRSRRNPNRR